MLISKLIPPYHQTQTRIYTIWEYWYGCCEVKHFSVFIATECQSNLKWNHILTMCKKDSALDTNLVVLHTSKTHPNQLFLKMRSECYVWFSNLLYSPTDGTSKVLKMFSFFLFVMSALQLYESKALKIFSNHFRFWCQQLKFLIFKLTQAYLFGDTKDYFPWNFGSF